MEELHEARKDDRSEFQRDYDRLIFQPFPSLQNKTQYFLYREAYSYTTVDSQSLRCLCVGALFRETMSPASYLKKHLNWLTPIYRK